MVCVGLSIALPSVSIAQDVRERVREALSYPPLQAQVNFGFDMKLDALRNGQTPAERIAQLERAVREKPDDADAWFELMEAYDSQHGDEAETQTKRREASERAARLYRAKLESSPDDARIMARLALALLGLNQPEEALKLAQRAVELNPRLADSWKALARALLAGSFWSLIDTPMPSLAVTNSTRLSRSYTPTTPTTLSCAKECSI